MAKAKKIDIKQLQEQTKEKVEATAVTKPVRLGILTIVE